MRRRARSLGPEDIHILPLWLDPRPKKHLRIIPNPPTPPHHPSLGARQDRQETSFHPAPSSRCQRGGGGTQVETFPPETHSVHSNIGTSPAPPPIIHQSVAQEKTNLLSSQGWGGAGRPISDIHSAHMLTSDSFVKYQCICCPGDVPKSSCTIHTHHSLFLFVSFIFFFFLSFFLCVL